MEEDKVEIMVLGLSPSSVPPNTYALILKEIEGNRSIPIVIGALEAQSIAIELDKTHQPPRPMTHDIVKTLIYSANLLLTEVMIYDLKEGTYFSRMVFADDDIEIDCRPSDAIAIALRCNAPIYVKSYILDEVGMFATTIENPPSGMQSEAFNAAKRTGRSKLEQLQLQLEKAIKSEDYETAARIRDEIKSLIDN
jgi:bifunctional DNase/RNase